jgi:hypothetical protein
VTQPINEAVALYYLLRRTVHAGKRTAASWSVIELCGGCQQAAAIDGQHGLELTLSVTGMVLYATGKADRHLSDSVLASVEICASTRWHLRSESLDIGPAPRLRTERGTAGRRKRRWQCHARAYS